MAKELNEDTNFKISVKTLISIGVGLSMLIGMWFTLQAQIDEAKLLPEPEVSKMEFDMKDVNIRQSIKNTEKDVDEIKQDLRRIEDKIDKLQ